MSDKEVYGVYCDLIKIHKEFAGKVTDKQEITELVVTINEINLKHSSNFCNAMTDALRQGFLKQFHGISLEEYVKFYKELWPFHRGYRKAKKELTDAILTDACELQRRYPYEICKNMIIAVLDEVDRCVQVENGESRENRQTQAEVGRNDEKQVQDEEAKR